MKNVCIVAPNNCKESALFLAKELNIPLFLNETRDLRMFDLVFNYGMGSGFPYNKVINRPESIKICINKISTLKRLKNCSTINWTQSRERAREWLDSDGCVVIRKLETGSQGKGMVVCENLETFMNTSGKFYTRVFNHSIELRVNVFKNKVLSVYEKTREETKGELLFNFNFLDIKDKHPAVEEMIKDIAQNINIDFYGMDILVNSKGTYRLLEVNSGPILHEETCEALIKELKKEK